MPRTISLTSARAAIALVGVGALASAGASASASVRTGAAASGSACSLITKQLVVAAGFKKATGPVVTAYNDANLSKNAANALGRTIDFGSSALVVSCASPTDLAALSVQAQGSKKAPMTASAYLQYLVRTSSGAMKAQPLGTVTNYVDFGNGKEDGLGSTSTATGVRLDSFAAGNYLISTQTTPISTTAPATLVAFAKAVTAALKGH